MNVAAAIAQAFLGACQDELEAPKPGNVHVFAGGHGWVAEDFRRSAHAAAPAIARAGAPVGQRILGAVETTHAAIGHNTNLGIALLCAPLARAAETPALGLRPALAAVLAGLDVADAEAAFRAIALAAPGGLGRVERHDVREPADVTLLQAMAEAAGRDGVARQYANGYSDVFDLGLPALAAAEARFFRPAWAGASAVFLAFLAAFPDSHIQRKHGAEAAADVLAQARRWQAKLRDCADPNRELEGLLAFDAALKARGLNPGTSADLTVATLFARRLTRWHLALAAQQ